MKLSHCLIRLGLWTSARPTPSSQHILVIPTGDFLHTSTVQPGPFPLLQLGHLALRGIASFWIFEFIGKWRHALLWIEALFDPLL